MVRRVRADRQAAHRGELESGDVDYEVDEKKRTVGVLEAGIEKVEDQLGIDNLYESVNTPLIGYLNNAIKAKELFKKDKDYVVVDGEVLIVDEYTGRMLAGRRYNEGMHQAIEAKEGVEIKDENQTLATITLQNYFRLYDKLSGMTGTAQTEAAEFKRSTSSTSSPSPPTADGPRMDQPDLVYKTERRSSTAVVDDIAERHEKGQPVLVGTRQRGEVRAPVDPAAEAQGIRTRSSTPSSTSARRTSSPRRAARAPSPSRRTWPAAAPTSCSAATPSSARSRSCRARGLDPVERPRGVRGRLARRAGGRREGGRGRARRGHRARRSLRPRHRAARVAAHRQPAARAAPAARATRASRASTSRCSDDLMRLFNSAIVDRFMIGGAASRTTCRSSRRWSPARSPARRARSRPRTTRSARTSSSTTTCSTGSARSSTPSAARSSRARTWRSRCGHFVNDVIDGYVDAATSRGLPRGLGPRAAVGRAEDALPPVSVTIDELAEAAGGREHISATSCATS